VCGENARRRWAIFEAVFGVPLLVAITLRFLAPHSLPGVLAKQLFMIGSVASRFTGILFVVLARLELSRRGEPTDRGLPTTRFVATIVFAVCRNPLYLGGVRTLADIALLLNLP
jgi:protein-S-isoprenylcysteine O-methyltransferase Ste14